MKTVRILNKLSGSYLEKSFNDTLKAELYLKSYVADKNYSAGCVILHLRDFEITEKEATPQKKYVVKVKLNFASASKCCLLLHFNDLYSAKKGILVAKEKYPEKEIVLEEESEETK
jgi:hypothetical protein